MDPLLSVFTAAHETGASIGAPWRSLLTQTHANWEWVVVDDSRGPDTIDRLTEIANSSAAQGRVRLHRREPDGSIGASKATAAGLCNGDILIELDHDDELLPSALETVAAALRSHENVDFVYSDWIDTASTGSGPVPLDLYPAGWGYGFGGYATEVVCDRRVPVALACAITWETVRHIVSMPNHLRAWRVGAYRRIGGFDPEISVGDDYELLVRTFLSGVMARIPRPLYVQHHILDGESASRARNGSIQDLVREVATARERQLDDRCLALGAIPNDGWALTSPEPVYAASVQIDPLADTAANDGMPLISVIISPAKESEELKRALAAVLDQSYPNTEVLVVGQECPFIDEVVSTHADQRVRHWNLERSQGTDSAAPRQYALNAMARGTFVALYDTSCVWSQNHLESELRCRESQNLVRHRVARGNSDDGLG